MRHTFMLAALLLCQHAVAQVAPFTYRLGGLRVTEDADSIVLHTPQPQKIDILPGGHTWPLLTLDEVGNIHVGDKILPAGQSEHQTPAADHTDERTIALAHGYRVTARERDYRIVHGRNTCTLTPRQLGLSGDKQPLEALQYGNLVFRASDRKLLALATWLGADKSDTRYAVLDIDLARCRTHRTSLGNPDLLVELGWSPRGGWWITGSIEQTLLRSDDGRHWRHGKLPADLSSLMSAYIVDAHDIWLAGILPGSSEDDPLLIRSTDGGLSWANVSRATAEQTHLPAAWLEGQRRLGLPIAP